MPPPCLLLDRDGVLNLDRPDYVRTPEQLILQPGAPEALALLTQAGLTLLVITNQACVGKGLVSPATLTAIHAKLQEAVAAAGGRIAAIYHCPHRDEDRCGCRKPQPGLILAAQREWGFDPAVTWLLGDSRRDLLAAQAAGCRAALVRTGHGEATSRELPDQPVFDNILAFAQAYLDPNSPLNGPACSSIATRS